MSKGNGDAPEANLEELTAAVKNIISALKPGAVRLKPRDRQRLKGVGPKIMGFIMRAFAHAMQSPQFLPEDLTLEKYERHVDKMQKWGAFNAACDQLREYSGNGFIMASDAAYADSRAFYGTARNASKRRLDGAEAVHRDLAGFFKPREAREGPPTLKEQKRDALALIDGRKDGEMLIKNVKPKLEGGEREVIVRKKTGNEE
jgi:hypothetical protein